MAAIVTNNFRKNNVDLLLEEINSSASPRNEYFVGLGKSDPWDDGQNIPLPSNTETENTDVLRNLIGLVKLDGGGDYKAVKIIPKNGWVSGRRYKKYDPADIENFDLGEQNGEDVYPSYVTYNDKIYICLQNGWDGDDKEIEKSTITPISGSNDDYGWYETNNDGYVWSFIGDVGTAFTTDQFVEVPQDNIDSPRGTEVTSGLLYGFHVEQGAITTSPNPSNFAIQLQGELLDGSDIDQMLSGVNVITNDDGDEIIRIEYDSTFRNEDSPIESHLVRNLKQANIIVQDDDTNNVLSEIKVIPLIAPEDGFGAFPSKDLPSSLLGIVADFNSDLAGEVPFTTFRQVSLIKNAIRAYDSPDNSNNTYSADSVYDTLKSIDLDDIAKVDTGDIIVGNTSGARAYVDSIDGNTIYYHQNSNNDVNVLPFSSSEIINNSAGNQVGTVQSLTSPEYQPLSGDVLFLENRQPIQRANNQNEQVRLVIQL